MTPATTFVGSPVSRVDGPAKVTGAAVYAADFDIPHLAHASIVQARVPAGRIAAIDTRAAEAAPGVLAVMTHETTRRLPWHPRDPRPGVDPKAGERLHVLQDDVVRYDGQPVALVVAQSEEQARAAADLVRVDYAPTAARTRFDVAYARAPSEATAKAGRPGDTSRGDPEGAFAQAPVRVDVPFVQPREQHAAIEPHATIAAWDEDGRLTLWDKSQWVDNVRTEIAHVFGLAEDRIRVISPFVGGAFGSGLRTWPHVTLAALAAERVGRPVRLALTRRQLFTNTGFRPHTESRVRLGAFPDGRLTAILHEATGQTSTYEEYAETTLTPARQLYACPNVATRYRLLDMNVNTPSPMRGPGAATGELFLETAMDELAHALGMNPLELRRANLAKTDPDSGKPWSSNALAACWDQAAARFGWADRPRTDEARRAGRERIGSGMASAFYPAHRAKARARVTLYANGGAMIQAATSDMGPGTYTALSQVAADALGLPLEQVRVEIGDSALPPAPAHGGSITMATLGNAVANACAALRETLGADGEGDLTPALRRSGRDSAAAEGASSPGKEAQEYESAAFGAVFAEVRVDPELGTVRVARLVGGYDVGRVVNPKLARSQCIGGMVQGIGMALSEEAVFDRHCGRVMNANLSDYLVPVCADVGALEAFFVESDDRVFNPLGVKGLAEIALCGVAAAIVNAVYDATGLRMREVPVTPERIVTAQAARGR
ncbi:xanthine dehydrogenase family protein molybdopterin-binding subunit [Salinarimonas rosea]|uniref:xanthine dehydrogenase family protein molybdopterin-binding subunit n=1 Tax=Salinarimonas rosea TaxID=552063 RepID=UPI00041C0740|nr:xanthine dehydrogenase family protein molybdopterin-binding subunit [Salinarimonas rosea]